MDSILPPFSISVLAIFSECSTTPTALNLRIICLSSIICMGRKTIANLIRHAGQRINLCPSSVSRVFSCRKINSWNLSRALCRYIVENIIGKQTLTLIADDTFMRRYGSKVFGRCRHRDAIRSSKRLKAHDWGHKWVVLCISIRTRFSSKPFALPVMIGLYRSKGWNARNNRKHRTPIQITSIFLYKIRKWFPQMSVTFVGDRGYGSFDLAKFCTRLDITIISRFHQNAWLVDPNIKRKKEKGRSLKYGAKMLKPCEMVEQQKPQKNLKVAWYSGTTRWLATCSSQGYWKRRKETLHVKWVYSFNSESNREEYFYTNNPSLTKREIIEHLIGRWPIETMFEETKQHLRIQGMKGYTESTVQSTVPGCFLLYSIIILLFLKLHWTKQRSIISWSGKTNLSFTDMLMVLRRELWKQWVIGQPIYDETFAKMPKELKDSLLYGLTPCN